MKNDTVYPAEALRGFGRSVLVALGFSTVKASLVAESLVAANLRGVDSHGIHLLTHYAKHVGVGNIDPNADGQVLSESVTCLLFDGQKAVGQQVSDICCRHAVRLGKKYGIGMVTARSSNHFGAAAFWAQRISSEGMLGIVMCNSSPSVPPWQGIDGKFGTNPLCMSIPSSGSGGWLLDMATTTVSMNKVIQAVADQKEVIPDGWAMDAEGYPTNDPVAGLKGLLVPLGGYKGSGLAMMVEILCAVLSGGAMSTHVGGVYILDRPMGTSQMFMAVDIQRFIPLSEFQTRMEQLVGSAKSARPGPGMKRCW